MVMRHMTSVSTNHHLTMPKLSNPNPFFNWNLIDQVILSCMQWHIPQVPHCFLKCSMHPSVTIRVTSFSISHWHMSSRNRLKFLISWHGNCIHAETCSIIHEHIVVFSFALLASISIGLYIKKRSYRGWNIRSESMNFICSFIHVYILPLAC